MTFYYVYILESEICPDRFYIGFTEDIRSRLEKHNSGSVTHTAKYRPWRVKNAFAFRDRAKALAFESYLKSGSGRAFASRHF